MAVPGTFGVDMVTHYKTDFIITDNVQGKISLIGDNLLI